MIMVRGRRIFMLRACVILVLAMAVLSRAYTPKETYIKSIREEWGIILPATEWEVYNEAIGSSFAGKGVRYHVFRYQDTSAIQKAVAWHRGRNMLVERKIDALLRDMDIAKGYEVNFNGEYQYFTLVKRGSTKELSFSISRTRTGCVWWRTTSELYVKKDRGFRKSSSLL